MALPYLVKHIYNSGTEEVIRRGKKIHALGNVELVEYDELMANVIFRVKDDGYATFYKVHINQFKDPKHYRFVVPVRIICLKYVATKPGHFFIYRICSIAIS